MICMVENDLDNYNCRRIRKYLISNTPEEGIVSACRYIWQLVAVFITAFFWLIPKLTLGKRAQEEIT